MKSYSWIIKGGRVIDPVNGIDSIRDVAIEAGQIVAIAEALEYDEAEQIYDATGKLVVPGLIDIHVHAYNLVTPLGIDADHYCLGRGVTTAVDAGSAGCDNYPGFRAFTVEQAKTRLLAFLNISRAGLAFVGRFGDDVPRELDLLKLIHTQDCIDCIESNRDLLVGVKIRLTDTDMGDQGCHEAAAFQGAQAAAETTGLPLMTHHSFSSVPLEACPGKLESGDIYTHVYHGFASTIIDLDTRRVHLAVRAARERGVLFDIGHGFGSFNWTVGEICAQEGFWPDLISTDLHALTSEGPAYDMPTVMSRLLHLGMPLGDVIKASTFSAAKAIGWENRIGTLGIGREADIAVLELKEVDRELEDCNAQMRRIKQRLITQAVWRAGIPGQITRPLHFPNLKMIEKTKARSSKMLIRDPH